MPTTHIYTLSDPRTDEVRYVGKTRDPKGRIRNHLGKREHSHKGNWIESLRKLGLKPVVHFIDEVPTEEWSFWEQHWIQTFAGWGFNLTNMNAGGGQHAYFTQELKVKHKASFTKEVRDKMRATAKVVMNTTEVKTRVSEATKVAMLRPGVKAKLQKSGDITGNLSRSEKARAYWADPEVRAKRIDAMLAANSNPEVKAKRSANTKAQFSKSDFSIVLSKAHAATSKTVRLTKGSEQIDFKSMNGASKFLAVDRAVVSRAASGDRKRAGNLVSGWAVTKL